MSMHKTVITKTIDICREKNVRSEFKPKTGKYNAQKATMATANGADRTFDPRTGESAAPAENQASIHARVRAIGAFVRARVVGVMQMQMLE